MFLSWEVCGSPQTTNCIACNIYLRCVMYFPFKACTTRHSYKSPACPIATGHAVMKLTRPFSAPQDYHASLHVRGHILLRGVHWRISWL